MFSQPYRDGKTKDSAGLTTNTAEGERSENKTVGGPDQYTNSECGHTGKAGEQHKRLSTIFLNQTFQTTRNLLPAQTMVIIPPIGPTVHRPHSLHNLSYITAQGRGG